MSVEPQAPMSETNGIAAPEAAAPKDELLSPKFAELARREKRIREQSRALEAQKTAKETEWKQKDDEYKSSFIHKNKLKENPLEALKELGLTQDQLVQLILNGPQQVDPMIQQLMEKTGMLEQKLTAAEKAAQEQQTTAYERAVAQIRSDAEGLVASDESYETIKEMDATEAVVELIRQTYETDKKLLTVAEAASQVEEYLVGEAMKMAGLKKIKAKLNPEPVVEDAPEAIRGSVTVTPKNLADSLKNQQTQTQIKTLTNSGTPASSKALSPRERALLAFQGKLNK